MKITTLLCAFILACVIAVPAAFSAEKKKPAPAEAPKKEEPKTDAKKDHYPLYGQVVSVTASTLTIKGGEGKEDRKFDITKETVIKKDDKAATVKDAKEGQWVGGYVMKDADGKGHDDIVSLNLSAKQKEMKPEEKKPAETTKPEATKTTKKKK